MGKGSGRPVDFGALTSCLHDVSIEHSSGRFFHFTPNFPFSVFLDAGRQVSRQAGRRGRWGK